MANQENSKGYLSLAQYADEKGVNRYHLQGAIYGLDIEMPIVAGYQLIDRQTREVLDPIVDRIRRRVEVAMNAGMRGRRGKRLQPTA